MKVEQLSIFLENNPGALTELTRVLSETGINIRSMALADTTDFGIVRMLVDDAERAKIILKEKGFSVGVAMVVAVEVPDRPGGLHSILEALSAKGINVEYMYAFVERSGENAVMIFKLSETDRAVDILTEAGFTVLPGSKVYSL